MRVGFLPPFSVGFASDSAAVSMMPKSTFATFIPIAEIECKHKKVLIFLKFFTLIFYTLLFNVPFILGRVQIKATWKLILFDL